MNFKTLIASTLDELTERALNLGNRTVTYPKSGQILILAGGAGSGKGFASKKVIAFDGKRFDVDELKEKMIKGHSKIICQKFKEQTGRDITTLNLSNPEDTSILHQFVEDNGYDKKVIQQFIDAQKRNTDKDTSFSGLKQNIIFDVTLKNIKKLKTIYEYASQAGYEKKNIHIVWILNDMEVAMRNNQGRPRVVAKEILMNTHEGASLTMHQLIQKNSELRDYMDGDVWVLFNNRDQKDMTWVVKDDANGDIGYVAKYTALQLKRQGQAPYSESEIEADMLQKIKDYVPVNSKTGKKDW